MNNITTIIVTAAVSSLASVAITAWALRPTPHECRCPEPSPRIIQRVFVGGVEVAVQDSATVTSKGRE
jgi:hypothetical protein